MQTSAQNKQPIIVILGMHRSGTSLLANFMHAIGIEFGQDLARADKYNASGYWESLTIRDIHDKMLDELDGDSLNPPVSLPAGWRDKPRIQELKNSLLEFVRSEYGRTKGLWGFKDPRTAIFLPLWFEIFDQLRLEPLYILCVRHPASVAASLDRRNQLAFPRSEALWLKYNLDILSYVPEKLRAIVDYDRWFDSGLEQAKAVVEALGPYVSTDEAKTAGAFDQVISRRLRHHAAPTERIGSPVVAKLYTLLQKASVNGSIPEEALEITRSYEESVDLFDSLANLAKGREEAIAGYKLRIKSLKKQKKILIYAVAILGVFMLISLFRLVGAFDWIK